MVIIESSYIFWIDTQKIPLIKAIRNHLPLVSLKQMSEKDFGGKRNFKTDFELYDERSKDKLNTTLDIFLKPIFFPFFNKKRYLFLSGNTTLNESLQDDVNVILNDRPHEEG